MTKFKTITQILLVASLLMAASSAQAALIRVSQESAGGAGDFDANVLGFIDSYSSALSAAAYYNYGNIPASFDDGAQDVTLTSNKSHLFFVDGSDGLSAYMVHDKPNDGAGGMAGMTLTLAGDTAAVLVRDDAGEGVAVGGGGTSFVSRHNWVGCCTDGFVIGSLDNDWELFAEFDSRSWNGFAGWMTFGSGNSIDLTSDLNRRVRFDVVPEPSIIALFGLGLIGMGFARRRKQ